MKSRGSVIEHKIFKLRSPRGKVWNQLSKGCMNLGQGGDDRDYLQLSKKRQLPDHRSIQGISHSDRQFFGRRFKGDHLEMGHQVKIQGGQGIRLCF